MTEDMGVYNANEGGCNILWIYSITWARKKGYTSIHQKVEMVFSFYSAKIRQMHYSCQRRGLLKTRGPDRGTSEMRNPPTSHGKLPSQHKIQLLHVFEDVDLFGTFQPMISTNCVISLDDFFLFLLEMTPLLLKSRKYYIEEQYKQW